MTDGLDAVREVATHWRRRYQAAQALIAELQAENEQLSSTLDWARDVVIKRWTKADEKIAELQAENEQLQDDCRYWQNSREDWVDLFFRYRDERNEARRWSAAWKRAAVRYRYGLRNLDPRIARLERITPPGPNQGVEDMYFTGESWQTEDE